MIPHVINYDPPQQIMRLVGEAEIVVGIPSKNTVSTITYVICNVVEGLRKYFNGYQSAVIVCDGLSTDGTIEVINVLKGRYENVAVIPNLKSSGKGGALRTIFELVSEHSNAKILVLVDSDLKSITPEWIALLGKGALEYDLVTPVYQRHKYDATLTNFITRPLTVLLYGLNIKQPIGGDFGLSRRLITLLAKSPLWTAYPWFYLFGADILITHTALASGLRLAEAQLKAKIHKAKDPSAELEKMFIEVTGAIFTLMFEYENAWSNRVIRDITDPPLMSKPKVPDIGVWEVQVSLENVKRMFIEGIREYREYYRRVLSENTVSRLYRESVIEDGVDLDLWANMLIDYATAYKKEYTITGRISILKTLLPLWQGRFYNYAVNVANLDSNEASRVIDSECREYFKYRDVLIEKYLG